jgi:uncharacterized membrane protein
MNIRLSQYWGNVRESYWFVPSLMAATATILSFATIQIDRHFPSETFEELGWIFSGGSDGAREILSTVAGSMITVAGVTFSITIIALSLASAQFGPRILGNFMRDTANQVVLGTFVSTFLYCLLALRTIRSSGDESDGFVPYLTITVGVALAVASLGVLIFFIHHVSISIQAPHVVAEVARELHASIERLFPERAGHGADEESQSHLAAEIPDEWEERFREVPSADNGYLEGVDLERLMELAREHDLVLRLPLRPGHFVAHGNPLLLAMPEERVGGELRDQLRDAFVVGDRRTATQDVEFPVSQLVEVALRGLSPSINDPFTAVNCIDHLGAALCHLLRREIPSAFRFDDEGRLRMISDHPLTFRGVVDVAFNQIRQNASYHASVRIRLLEAMEGVARCTRRPEERAALREQAELVLRGSREQVAQPEDLQAVEERFRRVLAALGDAERPDIGRVTLV